KLQLPSISKKVWWYVSRPTSSRSLCLPPARMHFWLSTARLYGRVPVPRKTSLNWFMPALVNSSVGSSSGTTDDDGTAVWPCFFTKKSRNCWRMSLDVGIFSHIINHKGHKGHKERT